MDWFLLVWVGLLGLILAVSAFNIVGVFRKARDQNYDYETDTEGVEHVKDRNDI